MNLPTVISVIVLSINLILGIFVYLKNRRSAVNKIFFGLTIWIVFWISGLFFITKNYLDLNYLLPLYGLKIAFAAAALLAFFFFYLSTEFPRKEEDIPRLFKISIFLITAFFVYISLFTSQVVIEIKDISGWKFVAEYGPFHQVFGLYFLSFMLIGIIILVRKLRKAAGIEKLQIQYFLTGASLSFVASTTTNLILPSITGISAFSKFGPIGTIFLVAFTFYAILRHHLMHVRVVATEIFTSIMILLFLVDIILSPNFQEAVIKSILLFFVIIFGILLIRGTLKEIETIKRLSETKSEFISIASHQLRTPLTAIKGYISLTLEGAYGKLPTKAQNALRNVYQSNERLIKLINDLLSVSRIESGKMDLHLEKISLEEIISSILRELEIKATRKNIYLKWEKPAVPYPKIRIDEEKIREAIFNLVDNAVRYTNRGGVTIKFKIQNSKFKIIISDTGEGIPKEELTKMFESFSRGTTGARLFTEGTGLGLYVAKKFVEMHNGRIWAESTGRGKGSTFYIELPIHPIKKNEKNIK
jgi:signal transduction histidine kinase